MQQSLESIPVAVVGMACQLPGARDLDEFWQLLIEGRSAIRELPHDRLDQELYYDARIGVLGKSYSRLGAIVASREFDRTRCPIPEALIQAVDPAHQLMCMCAAEALKHAGLDPFDLPAAVRNAGVYIGHAQGSELAGQYTYATCIEHAAEYLLECESFRALPTDGQRQALDELVGDVRRRCPSRRLDSPDVAAGMVAGAISKAFGLTGPFLAINSACASSLQSILLAARALQLGRVEMAIAGGASDCKSDSMVLFSAARAMSATGSRPFDADADGLVCGEGYGAIVMKTLPRALADGDRILAIIRGLGVSSDGKGRSLWAPRKEGQIKAMQRAYRAGLDIAKLQYVEAHSTATQLGDATELNTLKEILGDHFPAGKRIPITSLKANIGHALETAGIAGVIKSVLCIQKGMIPPALGVRKLNPNIDWDTAPFYVPTSAVEWPDEGRARRAGINAFGIGGLNMHVVIDQFIDAETPLLDPPVRNTAVNLGTTNRAADEEGIAVIGRGCVFPGAANLEQYWQMLKSRRDPKTHVTDRWRTDLCYRPNSREPFRSSGTLGGFIGDFEYDWRRHKIPPKQIAQADPLQFMLLDAADQALADAGYDNRQWDRTGCGVVVGTEFGGDFSFQLQMGLRLPDMRRTLDRSLQRLGVPSDDRSRLHDEFAKTLLEHWPALIDETGSFSTSSLASRIAKTWNLMGGAAAIDAGDVSSHSALSVSVDMLLAGDCNLVLCAAGQRRMGLPEYECLSIAGLLPNDPSPASNLDQHGGGCVPGEGVGVVLLKRLSDARRDGDRVHSIIRGVGQAHDTEYRGAIQQAMRRSFEIAQCEPQQTTLLELDAPTTEVVDELVESVASVHGARLRDRPLFVGSVASQIGHTQGASGIASLLKASLQLEHREVTGTVGLTNPVSSLEDHSQIVRAVTESTALASSGTKPVLATVFGISRGLACHVVLESGSEVGSGSSLAGPISADVPDSIQKGPSTAFSPPVGSANESAIAEVAGDLEPQDLNTDEVEAFLINFVVEHTGYPPDVVELDADLEADLGIDSIKKAQLFGELNEYFDVAVSENLTLDDFPTLRHVASFLVRPTKSKCQDRETQTSPGPPASAHQRRHAESNVEPELASPSPTKIDSSLRQRDRSAESVPRIVRFGATSLADFQHRLSSIDRSDPFAKQAFDAGDHVRLAFVAGDKPSLEAKLGLVKSHVDDLSARKPYLEQHGIFYRELQPNRPPRIAFLFAGQGSQYVGMLQELINESTAAADWIRHANSVLQRLGHQTFEEMAWRGESRLGSDPLTTQLSVLLADLAVDVALRSLGFSPDVVAGHSYGEYAALVAAESWSLEQAIRVTRARCDGIEACRGSDGGLLATTASVDQVRPHLTSIPAYIANCNGPGQTVVGGGRDTLTRLAKRLEADAISARMIDVPCPFHTPLMREGLELLNQGLQAAQLEAPKVTLYSCVTNRPVYGAEQIRANLLAHLTSPVYYDELVRRIVDEGPTVCVEIGPQQTLTKLNQSIFRDGTVDLIATDHPKRRGLEQLLCVRALLECAGAIQDAALTKPGASTSGEILRFDATQRRREKMRRKAANEPTRVPRVTVDAGEQVLPKRQPDHSGDTASSESVAVPTEPLEDASTQPASGPQTGRIQELESFLINFVVEQTGYPPEVVELDADLEADLGIDSIKKAQLFGELQEYFDVTPTEGLTLDDFPTLGHVVAFLTQVPVRPSGESSAEPTGVPASFGPSISSADEPSPDASVSADLKRAAEPASMVATATPTDSLAAPGMLVQAVPVVCVSGSPYEMGRQHGEAMRDPILTVLRRVADLTDDNFCELPLPLDEQQLNLVFDSDQMSELRGIADAVKVPLGNLLALNSLLALELGSGNAQFAAVRDEEGVLQGVVDQLVMSRGLCECLQPIVTFREPVEGIGAAIASFAGSVLGLAGINAAGLSATAGGSAHPVQRDERLQNQTSLLPKLLGNARTIDDAASFVEAMSHAGRWTVMLGQAGEQDTCCLQYDGTSTAVSRHRDLIVSSDPASGLSEELDSTDWRKRLTTAWQSEAAAQESLSRLRCTVGGDPYLSIVLDPQQGAFWIDTAGTSTQPRSHGFKVNVGRYLPLANAQPSRPPSGGEAFQPVPYDLPEQAADDLQIERFVMRPIHAPWPIDSPTDPQLTGPVLIVGEGPLAKELEKRLSQFATTIVHSDFGHSIEAAIDLMDRVWEKHQAVHLFLIVRDEQAIDRTNPSEWDRVYRQRVLHPYFLLQRWVQLAIEDKMIDRCSVVAVTDLGGDFGFSGNVAGPESGALTGLIKALSVEYRAIREFSNFRVKAIDAPLLERADVLAECVIREMASGLSDYEVAFVSGLRYVQIAIPSDAQVKPLADIRPGSTWVVTGGARGITALCARELGRRFGVKLHLIGGTALSEIDPSWRGLDAPQRDELRSQLIRESHQAGRKLSASWDRVEKLIEIDATLQNMKADGTSVTYHACDVSDRDSLSRVLQQIRDADGPIAGIVHGAGFEKSHRFENKNREDSLSTFAAKVSGAYNLMSLTWNDPVGHFIGFGSISGRLGSNGQADYCAASDMLCKMISWYGHQRRDGQATGIHWHGWDDVGMAKRPETRANLESSIGVKVMPSRIGVRHFLRELYAGPSDHEVLITQWDYHQRFYPSHVRELADDFESGRVPTTPFKNKQLADRHVLRMCEAPMPPECDPAFTSLDTALILGNNADARAVCEHLQANNVNVQALDQLQDWERAVAQLDQLWKQRRSQCLIVMTPRSSVSETHTGTVVDRLELGVYLPYLVIQHWLKLAATCHEQHPVTIAAATSLGGDFGFANRPEVAEGGFLCGLLKSIYVEDGRSGHSTVRVKIIDSPADEAPEDLANAICRELTTSAPEVEVAWSRGRRSTVATVSQPCPEVDPSRPRPGGTWVATGGARGVTAFLSYELARRYGLKMHLIGKSPPPSPSAAWRDAEPEQIKAMKKDTVREAIASGQSPDDEWGKVRKDMEICANLKRFRNLGIDVTYHSCDVVDESQLSEVLDEIRRVNGPIEGIIHGAGYAKPARFQSQIASSLRKTVAPKIAGAINLIKLTKTDPIRHFVGLGSLSGRFGGNGLSDYAAANDMLAKLCGRLRHDRPNCQVTCFHFQSWDQIGMAMFADGVDINKSKLNMQFIAPMEGVRHVHDELLAGTLESEVLITDGRFQRAFYPYDLTTPRRQTQCADRPAPLLDAVGPSQQHDYVARFTFHPSDDPFLSQHRLRGKPLMPAVIGLEAICESAFAACSGQPISEICNTEFENGMLFHRDAEIAGKVTCHGDRQRQFCVLTSKHTDRSGRLVDSDRRHLKATVHFGSPGNVQFDPIDEPLVGWHPQIYPEEGLLYHGPALRCLKEVVYREGEGWGRVVSTHPAELGGARRAGSWMLAPAVLDACLVACGTYAFVCFGSVEIPLAFDRIQPLRAPRPGELCIVHWKLAEHSPRGSTFHWTLYGEDAMPLCTVNGFRTINLNDAARPSI